MTTITETIPSLGSPPLTTDPANFDTRADTLYGTSLPAVITSTNTWSGQANALAVEVNSDKDAASASAVAAAASAVTASGHASTALTYSLNAASSANFAGAWSSLTGALNKPASVSHVGRFWILLNNLANVTTSEPGVSADWVATGVVMVDERTSNSELDSTALGLIIKYTSGTFTQTFASVSTLDTGWYVWLKNDGAGDITLDPNGSETISGLTSFIMYPGEMRLVVLNEAETGFDSFVLNSFEKTFHTSGTFTKPPGYKAFDGFAWSAGASGARNGSAARGGCGGGCFPFSSLASTFGATETITIGAGGTARTTDGTPNVGGNTTIGSLITVLGASDSVGGAVSPDGTTRLIGSGTSAGFAGATNNGAADYGGSAPATSAAVACPPSVYGGAGGGSHDGTLRAAGVSLYGGSGGAAGDSTNGTNGVQPGGGGGATRTGTSSGAGGNGRVIIRGVI